MTAGFIDRMIILVWLTITSLITFSEAFSITFFKFIRSCETVIAGVSTFGRMNSAEAAHRGGNSYGDSVFIESHG